MIEMKKMRRIFVDQWRNSISIGCSLTNSNYDITGYHTRIEFISAIYSGRMSKCLILKSVRSFVLDWTWTDYFLYWSICFLVNID